jgi:hypothetical protein
MSFDSTSPLGLAQFRFSSYLLSLLKEYLTPLRPVFNSPASATWVASSLFLLSDHGQCHTVHLVQCTPRFSRERNATADQDRLSRRTTLQTKCGVQNLEGTIKQSRVLDNSKTPLTGSWAQDVMPAHGWQPYLPDSYGKRGSHWISIFVRLLMIMSSFIHTTEHESARYQESWVSAFWTTTISSMSQALPS